MTSRDKFTGQINIGLSSANTPVRNAKVDLLKLAHDSDNITVPKHLLEHDNNLIKIAAARRLKEILDSGLQPQATQITDQIRQEINQLLAR